MCYGIYCFPLKIYTFKAGKVKKGQISLLDPCERGRLCEPYLQHFHGEVTLYSG